MKLIVGLGNPGKKYQGSRHNVGFEVIAELHRRCGSPRPSSKFNSELASVRLGQEPVLLQSPLTWMNLSGQAVRAAMDFYKLSPDNLLIICDDFNLPLARLRIRPSGSGGGQNGLQDVIDRLGTPVFGRLRIGIGPVPAGFDPANWVLGRFTAEERTGLDPALGRAADAVEVWAEQGVAVCMNRFNTAAAGPSAPTGKRKSAGGSDGDHPEQADADPGDPGPPGGAS